MISLRDGVHFTVLSRFGAYLLKLLSVQNGYLPSLLSAPHLTDILVTGTLPVVGVLHEYILFLYMIVKAVAIQAMFLLAMVMRFFGKLSARATKFAYVLTLAQVMRQLKKSQKQNREKFNVPVCPQTFYFYSEDQLNKRASARGARENISQACRVARLC